MSLESKPTRPSAVITSYLVSYTDLPQTRRPAPGAETDLISLIVHDYNKTL